MRWEGHVARVSESRGAYRVLVGKSEERLRHDWEDNIKWDLREMECGDME
jgi:hypothetical protein